MKLANSRTSHTGRNREHRHAVEQPRFQKSSSLLELVSSRSRPRTHRRRKGRHGRREPSSDHVCLNEDGRVVTALKFLELGQQTIASHMAELETGTHDMVDPLSKDKKRTRAGMPAKVPYLTWAGEVPLDSCLGHTVVSGTEGWLLAGYAYLKLTPLVVLPTPGLGQTSPQYSWPFLRRCFPCVADLATRHWRRGFGDALRDEGRRRDLARNIRCSAGSWVACTSACLVAT